MTDTALRLPAEWETQSAVMLTWPHEHSDWQPFLKNIEPVYVSLCQSISECQCCLILCYDDEHRESVMQLLRNNSVKLTNCQLVVCRTNDTWCRDYAPLASISHEDVVLQNFAFNAWGGKYDSTLDNSVSRHLHNLGVFNDITMYDHDDVLEGGSIDSNGAGTILTTSECLLNRHPGADKTQLEDDLRSKLGIHHILWLDHGSLSGDDTDSHIDNLARFVNESTIVFAACDDLHHPDYHSLQAMHKQLQGFRQPNGVAYNLIPIPLPSPIVSEGQHLPASYVNFLIINGAVLVPTFDQPSDATALDALKNCFPNRSIIGIDSRALIKQYGGIHCATMQFPEGVISLPG